ncbi:MAG TPA: VOC family protein [Solirubrobacteraceae bacterium]|jgi:catechol 2,3-dioxygenase-like lactoylglutathione lyase family enzyme
MLGRIDHVGYIAADLEQGVATFTERLGAEVVRRFERRQFSLVGVYLGAEGGNIEVFSFTEPELLAARTGGRALALDHVAYEVADMRATEETLRAQGIGFCGPDLRDELTEAVDLGGVLHIWTRPATCSGVALQLMQRVVSLTLAAE